MSKQRHSNTLKKIMSHPAGTEFNEFEETTSGTGRIWWHKLRICSDFSVTWQIINDLYMFVSLMRPKLLMIAFII